MVYRGVPEGNSACELSLGHNFCKSGSALERRDFNLRGLSTPLRLAWLVLALAITGTGLDLEGFQPPSP